MVIPVLLCCIYFFSSIYGGPSPASNLQVEYLPSPVRGVDVNPRFSWQLGHTDRSQYQTAYQISVSSKSGGTGDIWNSGKVATNQSAQVEFAGSALQSDSSYFWTVTWWDASGTQANASAEAQFDTGVLNPAWPAAWIGGFNQLRKEFNLSGAPTRARLYICGLGYYEAYINGHRVGDKVLGPFTQFEQHVLYDTHDVTAHLNSGANALAVMLGRGFYAHGSVNAGPISLIAMLSVQAADGTTSWAVKTDTTWMGIAGPYVSDDVYIGVTYDARRETPGWDKPGYMGAGWAPATSVQVKGTLKSYLAHPQKIVQTLTPLNINEIQPGIYVLDFGQNIAGYTQINAVGPAGTSITFRHGEQVLQDGTVANLYSDAPMIDTFILAGTGQSEYMDVKFAYHGFQYLQVSGFPGTPATDNFVAFFIHTAMPVRGNFGSSSQTLNFIEHMTKYASLANLQSIPTDCPTREKRGWLGDAQASGETILNFWDMGAFYTKFLWDIQDSQVSINKGGQVGDTAPFYNWGSNLADPAWGTAYTLLWYWTYLYYDDTRMLTDHYDGVKLYVESIIAEADPNTGILMWSRYGDWCAIADGPWMCAYTGAVVSAFYFYEQLRVMVEISDLLGKSDDTARYSAILKNVTNNWNDALYNPSNYTYNQGYQTYQVLPLWLGIVPQSDYDNVVNYFLNDLHNVHNDHLTVGVVGAKYLLPMLQRLGRTDLAMKVALQEDYPGWGYFASQGATTLWENWNNNRYQSYGSRNHIMFGGQGAWYYNGIAGIQMTPGTRAYEDITVAPAIADTTTLTWAEASLATQRGLVSSEWTFVTPLCGQSSENTNLTLSCPNGVGVIQSIEFASFGTATGVCGNYNYSSCNSNKTMQIVEQLCVGKTSCTIYVSDGVFGDPCFGTVKYLAVQVAGCNAGFFNMYTNIPVNSIATVVIPTNFALSNISVIEAAGPVWENGAYVPGTSGIYGATQTASGLEVRVGSGSYNFALNGTQATLSCETVAVKEMLTLSCPPHHTISRVRYAHFGGKIGTAECGAPLVPSGTCSVGSGKHVIEKACLNQNRCSVPALPAFFGDENLHYCKEYDMMHVEYYCTF